MEQNIKKTERDLKEMVRKARSQKKWIFINKYRLWFSPDIFEEKINNKKFVWSTINFTLREPIEYIDEIEDDIKKLIEKIGDLITLRIKIKGEI